MKIYEEDNILYVEMLRPSNFHVHLRELENLEALVPYSARKFYHIMAMPNTKKPLTTSDDVLMYQRAIEVEGQMWNSQSHTALYLTDNTTKDDLVGAMANGAIAGKLYPAGATTNSNSGVTDIRNAWPLFGRMQQVELPLSIHCEDTNPEVDIFDRERSFIDKYLEDIVIDFPELPIIFEHVSTKEGVDFVKNMPNNVVATITPHHMLCNRNDLLARGICPSKFCFPVLNRRSDQEAVISVTTSGNKKFFLGTDSAPHPINKKFCDNGAGGCFTEPYAMQLYLEVFDKVNALDKLEDFASIFGPKFYGLSMPTTTETFCRKSVGTEELLQISENQFAVPFTTGKSLGWQRVG